MSESNRCPVCGSPPNAVDYFEFVDEHGKPTRIPGTWHCPNEMDDAHTGGPALATLLGITGNPPKGQDFILRHTGEASLDPPPVPGEVIEATIIGTELTIRARWGTSQFGPEWQVISDDIVGHLPTDSLCEIRRISQPAAEGR